MTIQEMREKIAAKRDEARVLNDEHKDNWTEDNQKKFDALMKEIDGLQASIDRELQLNGLEDSTEDGTAAIAAGSQAAGHVEVGHEPVYRNIGEQLMDIQAMTMDTPEAPRARDRHQQVVNAAKAMGMSTGNPSEGGYLVETNQADGIMQTAVETGVFTSGCTTIGIGQDADSYEYMAADDRDQSQGTVLGGIKAFRKSEKKEMTEWSTSKLEPKEIRVEDTYVIMSVTNRMLRDAAALTSTVKAGVPTAFGLKLDEEAWEGSGVGMCLGASKSPIMVSVPKEVGQEAGTVVTKNLVNMLARFYGTGGVWNINPEVMPQLMTLTLGDKPIYLPGGYIDGAPFGTLLGKPLVPTDHNEVVGSKGDIVLADWSQYLIVAKGGTEAAESMHVKFLTDEMVFRFTQRTNGQPLHSKPITPKKGTATRSPFVALADRK